MVFRYCSLSLLKHLVVLALIDLTCEIIAISLTTFHLVKVVQHAQELRQTSVEISDADQALYFSATIAIATHTIHVALHLFQLGLSILLLVGTFQKSIRKCRIWLNITAVILSVSVISTIANYVFGYETGRSSWSIGPTFIFFVYKGYMLWVVHSFINLLRFNNHTVRYERPQIHLNDNQDDDLNLND